MGLHYLSVSAEPSTLIKHKYSDTLWKKIPKMEASTEELHAARHRYRLQSKMPTKVLVFSECTSRRIEYTSEKSFVSDVSVFHRSGSKEHLVPRTKLLGERNQQATEETFQITPHLPKNICIYKNRGQWTSTQVASLFLFGSIFAHDKWKTHQNLKVSRCLRTGLLSGQSFQFRTTTERI